MKWFNYRPLVSIFLFLMAGIIFVVGCFSQNAYRIAISCLMLAALVVTIVVKAVKSKDKKLFKTLSVLVAFMLGSLMALGVILIDKKHERVSGEYVISGRVCERPYVNDNNWVVVTLDDVVLGEKKNSGNLRLYLESDDNHCLDFALGERVTAAAEVINADLFDKTGEPSFWAHNKGITLIGFGEERDVYSNEVIDANIFDKLKTKVKSILDKNLSPTYSEVAFAMLFSDKVGIPDVIKDNYSASGISHILAVSGLHVGFIVTMLSLLLGLFKAGRKVKFIVISLIVFLYAFVCGFPVSTTRALIMTIVLLYSKMRLREYDGLSSLAFAGLIIVCINPLDIYDVGFQLSFSAVASIIILSRPLENLFAKVMHKKLASALALSTAATVGTMPIIAHAFSMMSLFAVVTNVLIIPIVSLAFMWLFVMTILSLIMPFMGAVLKVFEWLMKVVTGISSLTGAINLAAARPIMLSVFSVIFIIGLIVSSDYVFLSNKRKAILTSCIFAASILCFGLSFV